MTENLNIEWEEVRYCPLCDNVDHEYFHVYVPDERPITHWRLCPKCGHVFCSPRPTEAWLAEWYKCGYRTMSYPAAFRDEENPDNVPETAVRDEMFRAIRLLHLCLRTIKKADRVLDVGCSTGILLAGFLDKFRTKESWGVEPNDCFRQFAKARTQDAIEEGYEDSIHLVEKLVEVPKSPLFDTIVVIHTLEHVVDPLGLLITLRKYLRQDGNIIVETPRLFGGNCDPLLFPHIHCFHHETLLDIVKKAGYYPFMCETSGMSDSYAPYHMSPANITVVASIKPHQFTVKDMLARYNLYREHTASVEMQKAQDRARGYGIG